MTTTVFVNGSTLSDADWFNDVNRLHYTILGDPADAAAVISALGTATTNGFTAFKVGTFTRVMSVASGAVAYAGVGFKPKAIVFFANVQNGAVQVSSKGFSDGTTNFQLLDYHTTASAGGFNTSATAIFLFDDAGTANSNSAVVASFDVDGFTLTWTKSNTPTSTATIGYLAFK